jgi:hypothetical protein
MPKLLSQESNISSAMKKKMRKDSTVTIKNLKKVKLFLKIVNSIGPTHKSQNISKKVKLSIIKLLIKRPKMQKTKKDKNKRKKPPKKSLKRKKIQLTEKGQPKRKRRRSKKKIFKDSLYLLNKIPFIQVYWIKSKKCLDKNRKKKNRQLL